MTPQRDFIEAEVLVGVTLTINIDLSSIRFLEPSDLDGFARFRQRGRLRPAPAWAWLIEDYPQ